MSYINRVIDNIKEIEESMDGQKLVCVTKKQSIERVDELAEIPTITDIGENTVQGLLAKKERYGKRFSYHMIGRLQTNKVKYLAGFVEMIHSLDRLKLAKELEKQGAKKDYVFDVLVQLNISREETKTGLYPEDVEDFLKALSNFNHIRVRGFMTMAPYTDDQDLIRSVFSRAKKIFDKYHDLGYNNFSIDTLSMGMSNDYRIALEEGATMIRVGSSVFK